MSIVRKRDDISADDFSGLWLGEHAAVARLMPGLREYTVDFVTPGDDGPGFDGIATVRFDTLEALNEAFGDPALSERLRSTRDAFASSVSAFLVEEHRVFASSVEASP